MKLPYPFTISSLGSWVACGLVLLLGSVTFPALFEIWKEDSSLGHSPILCLISLGLLWNNRKEFSTKSAPIVLNYCVLIGSMITHIVAVWADIAFLKPVSFFCIISGVIGVLFGDRAFRGAVAALGLLVFTAPWPTTLVEKVSFPLQLSSSSYAAFFTGMLGIPIHREGVEIHVLNASGDAPIYSILVAQKCSGLTSLNVLLSLGYLIALLTPIAWWGRILLVGIVVPLTLFANATRLMFILIAGAYHGSVVAQWIHDHEQPVLIFFCSLGLMSTRSVLMRWLGVAQIRGGDDEETSTSC